MRTSQKAFLCCCVLAGVLLAAGGAMAVDLPMTCSANGWYGDNGLWTLTATGPTQVGDDTQITYTVEYLTAQRPDHFGALATITPGQPNDPVILSAGRVYDACEGDTLTGLGKLSCHQRAIRVDPAPTNVQSFTVRMTGKRKLVPSSFVIRNNKSLSACAIAGLGELEAPTAEACVSTCGDFHPKQTILKEEVYRFATGTGVQCFAYFKRDTTTGEVVEAGLTDDSDADCDFEVFDVGQLQLLVNGLPIGGSGNVGGQGQFGDGILSTGSNSCTTRVIGGKVYTWGSPCPQ